MDFNRAKNLILSFLLVLNIFLYILTSFFKTSYKMTLSQEKNIINILSNNNIGLYVELPIQYKPKKELLLKNSSFLLTDSLIEVFFDDKDAPVKFQEDNKTTYQGSGKTLIIQDGYYTLNAPDGIEPINILTQMPKSFSNIFKKFYLDNQYTIDEYTVFEYRDKYENSTIYSNFIEMYYKDDKVTKIVMYYSEPTGFVGEYKDIISPDMALFTFTQEINKISTNEEIFIDSIDIVYVEFETVDSTNLTSNAIPCYRIGTTSSNVPYLIDAYSNIIIN